MNTLIREMSFSPVAPEFYTAKTMDWSGPKDWASVDALTVNETVNINGFLFVVESIIDVDKDMVSITFRRLTLEGKG